jgi:hypothetical protein
MWRVLVLPDVLALWTEERGRSLHDEREHRSGAPAGGTDNVPKRRDRRTFAHRASVVACATIRVSRSAQPYKEIEMAT